MRAAPSPPRSGKRRNRLTLDAEAGGALPDCSEGMLDLDELARGGEGGEGEAAERGERDEEKREASARAGRVGTRQGTHE
mgnify:CR=1 FL=1